MLGREIIECQQFIAVPEQAFGGIRVFRLEGVDEQIERGMCILAGLGLPYVMQHFLRLGLGSLGEIVQDIAGFVHPAPLLAGCRKNLFQRRPEPHGRFTECSFPEQY